MDLQKELYWDYDSNRKIGHIRVEYNEDKLLANQWSPMGSFLLNQEIKETNKAANFIQDRFSNFQDIVSACGGEGLQNETNLFCSSENFHYWIRLIPIKNNHNMYINILRK